MNYDFQVLNAEQPVFCCPKNSSTLSLVSKIEAVILKAVFDLTGENFTSLPALDGFLMETEASDRGIASFIREMAKTAFTKELEDFSRQIQLESTWPDRLFKREKLLDLHPIVRLRTNIKGLSYTSSRPHQDLALWPESGQRYTVWLSLRDMDEFMAPLRVYMLKRSLLLKHTRNQYSQLELNQNQLKGLGFRDFVLEKGGVVVFGGYVPHHSLENKSHRIRWSLDFRLSLS